MSQVGSGEVAILPTFKGFRSGVTSEVDATASASGSRFAAGFGKAVKGIGKGIATGIGAGLAVVATGVAAIASKGLDRALNIQDAKAQLKGLGHDTKSVTTIMESALASVKGTAFGLDQAATIAASAVAAGIKPGQELTRTLKLTADAATIGKSSLSEMGQIIGKVASSGKLNTEVLNQFHQRGVPLLQFVAKEYGVTAEAASEMVSKGEVDFARFQSALEKGVGGAALASGDTARGAFKNIGAAFGRLGAMFVSSSVDAAPSLFVSIANAVDRLAEALKPVAERFNGAVTPAFAALGAWIDRIDFGKIVAGIREFYLGAIDVKDLLTTGFTENESLLPPSAIAGLQTAHKVISGVVSGIRDLFSGLSGGGGSGELNASLASMGTSLQTLQPAFKEFGSQMPKIGGAIAKVAAGGITVLTGALSFLADNVDSIIAWMPAIVAGFLLWKGAMAITATASYNLQAAQLAALPVNIANNALRLSIARAELQVAAATGVSTAAERSSLGAKVASAAANVRAVAATVAARVAMVAGAVATGVATAAQWAWNAALTANPIGLVIAAIVALVAGLIWFFTQTELGKQIWGEFTRFLTEAWTNIASFFSTVWNGIVQVFQFVWKLIVLYVTTYINVVRTIITTVINVVSTIWRNVWNGISGFFKFIWGAIVLYVRTYIQTVRTIITTVVTAIQNTWRSIWSGISSFFSGIWRGIVAAVSSFGQFFRNAFSGIAGFVRTAFNGVLSAVRGPINAIIGLVNSAIRGLNSISVTIPAWVPIVGGQSFGINLPTIPRLAEGGIISARPGGGLYNIGEGRYDEAVVPLDKKFYDALEGGGGSGGGGEFTGNLYMDSGEFVGLVRGEIRRADEEDERTTTGKRRRL